MTIPIVTVIFLSVIVFFYVVSIYNRLANLKFRIKSAFKQIEQRLKRRYDLIPNLVETAKSEMCSKNPPLASVVYARNSAIESLKSASIDPGNRSAIQELSSAEKSLYDALHSLYSELQSSPELMTNADIVELSKEIALIEKDLPSFSEGFNSSVGKYNRFRESFPPVFFASIFGHENNAGELDISAAVSKAA